MKPQIVSLLSAALAVAVLAGNVVASTPRLLDIQGRASDALPPALVAGETVTLRLLLPPGTDLESIAPRLFQTASEVIQIPLRPAVTLSSDANDSRLTLASFTLPHLARFAHVDLDLGLAGSIALSVFPSDLPRADQPLLAEALASSRLRLAVASSSAELRDYLRAEKIAFTDLGAAIPDRLEKNVLLLAELTPEAWATLAPTAPVGARLIAFVADPAMLPGVYAASAAGRTKVTLPLLPFLMADPRARATLHALLLQTLSASSDTLAPSF